MNTVRRGFIISLLAGAGVLFAADPDGFQPRTPRYRIETSDIIEVQFRFTPEFNQTVTVQPDGFVPLIAAGDLQLSGKTLEEAREAIAAKYTGILRDPVITLTLKEFNKPYFVVGGEVAHPGKFDLRGGLTLSSAMAIAGGFTPNAKQDQVLLFRRVSPETVEVKRVNLKSVYTKGNFAEDIVLQPGDSIYASKSIVGKIDRFLAVSRLGFWFPLSFK